MALVEPLRWIAHLEFHATAQTLAAHDVLPGHLTTWRFSGGAERRPLQARVGQHARDMRTLGFGQASQWHDEPGLSSMIRL